MLLQPMTELDVIYWELEKKVAVTLQNGARWSEKKGCEKTFVISAEKERRFRCKASVKT